MAQFRPLRGKPRIVEVAMLKHVDLPEHLDQDPEVLRPELLVSRSESGRTETQPRTPYSGLSVRCAAVDEPTMNRLRQVFDRTLAKGRQIELIRDSSRCFHLFGDELRDCEGGNRPATSSVCTLVARGGRWGLGSIAVDQADPPGCTRTNLIPNGDSIDGTLYALPTGWTNGDTATLNAFRSTYTSTDGESGSQIEFHYKTTGTKSAYLTFDFNSKAPNATPARGIAFSFFIQSDRSSQSTVSNAVLVQLVVSGGSTYTIWQGTPTADGQRVRAYVDLTGDASATTTGHQFKVTLTDALSAAPVRIREIQAEHRRHPTAFIPYSTARSLTGSRAQGFLKFAANRLAYAHQLPVWANKAAGDSDDRWGYIVDFDFTPSWSATNLPGWVVDSTHNVVRFTFSAVNYTATIASGQYDALALANAIQVAMRALEATNNYTCTWDTATLKFTIAGTGSFDIQHNYANSLTPSMGYTSSSSSAISHLCNTADSGYVTLYADGDAAFPSGIPALLITASCLGAVATWQFDDGTVVANTQQFTWTQGSVTHLTFVFKDAPSVGASGGYAYFGDAGTLDQVTHTKLGARVGQSLWLGSDAAVTRAANGAFNNVIIETGGFTLPSSVGFDIDDYYPLTEAPPRIQTAFRAVLDPKQAGRSDSVKENSMDLNWSLIETRLGG